MRSKYASLASDGTESFNWDSATFKTLVQLRNFELLSPADELNLIAVLIANEYLTQENNITDSANIKKNNEQKDNEKQAADLWCQDEAIAEEYKRINNAKQNAEFGDKLMDGAYLAFCVTGVLAATCLECLAGPVATVVIAIVWNLIDILGAYLAGNVAAAETKPDSWAVNLNYFSAFQMSVGTLYYATVYGVGFSKATLGAAAFDALGSLGTSGTFALAMFLSCAAELYEVHKCTVKIDTALKYVHSKNDIPVPVLLLQKAILEAERKQHQWSALAWFGCGVTMTVVAALGVTSGVGVGLLAACLAWAAVRLFINHVIKPRCELTQNEINEKTRDTNVNRFFQSIHTMIEDEERRPANTAQEKDRSPNIAA